MTCFRPLLLALLASAPALAEPACRGVAPLPGPPPPAQLVVEKLGIAVRGNTLSLWPLEGTKLNPAAGVALTYANGQGCVSGFSASGARGIRLETVAPVAVVEIAVCAADGGMCVPIRAALSP